MTGPIDAAAPADRAAGPSPIHRPASRAGRLERAAVVRAVTDRWRRVPLERRMAWLVLGFALVARLLTLDLPRANGDGPRKWMWARVVHHGWPPSSALWEGWDHHAARLSINVPTLAIQWLFGDHPALYFAAPLCAFLLSLYCLFRIALRCGGVGVATWTGLAWAWLAPSYWVADMMPSAFSPAYSLAAMLCAIRLVETESKRGRVAWLLGAAGCMMLAELAKVTNLFFVPGLMLGLWVGTRQLRWPLYLALAVSVLMGIEWLAYQWSPLDAPWGRASVILAKHFGSKRTPIDGLWGLLERQERMLATTMPGLFVWLFLIIGSWSLLRFRERPLGVRFVVAAGLSYLFFHVLGVRSIDPVLGLQPPHGRYVVVVVPLALVMLGWWWARLVPSAAAVRGSLGRAASAFALMLLLYAYAFRFPGADEHPFARLHRMRNTVQAAYAEGAPILAKGSSRYELHATIALFWDDFDSPYYRVERRAPRPGKIKTRRGVTYRFLVDAEKLPSTKWSVLRQSWGSGRALLVNFRGKNLTAQWTPFSRL